MPYDPSLPLENTEIDAAQMRSQLQGLKALIDAILSISDAQVDGVNTLNPGDAANASVSVAGNVLHFTFSIPRGADGTNGVDGTNGTDGTNGVDGTQGPQGPPFANAIADAVNTLDPGNAATVSVSFDGTNVHFTFGIPRGQDGTNGIDGTNGTDGTNGADGEVSSAELANAISGTANNINSVATMDTPFVNDPPTLADIELLRTKVNEFILAARR